MPDDIFEDILSVSRGFRRATRSHSALQDYSWHLEHICSLLRQTHGLVVRKLEAIERAKSIAEAKRAAAELREGPLTHSFRISGLCDVFEGFGRALESVLNRPELQQSVSEVLKPGSKEQQAWVEFSNALVNREGEVAFLYSSEIREVADVVSASEKRTGLKQMQERAKEAKMILTDQMADFGALARDFAGMLPD